MVSRFSPFLTLLASLCSVLMVAQDRNPEFDREVAAGRQAAERGNYDEAATHLTAANQFRQGKCSECYVWLARIEMAQGNLSQASEQIEKAVVTATAGPQQATAQLYRGVVLSRQGDLGRAETAFRAASAANPDCVECRFNLGFVLLKESKDTEGVAVLKAVAPKFAGTPRAGEIQKFIADPGRIRRNYAPEFSAKLRSGEEISLDKLSGKVVLLDFWGTWCAPCRASLPLLKDLAAGIDTARVAIVSVDEGDSREKWDGFVRENNMTWPQVYDGEDRSLYRAFQVDGFPRYVLIGKDGTILREFKGWAQDGEATISEAIAHALRQ